MQGPNRPEWNATRPSRSTCSSSAPASPASAPASTSRSARARPTPSSKGATIGGTWDLFRYPGVRSDSDMHTLGYRFKPWREAKAIADGPSILEYVQRDGRRVRHRRATSASATSVTRADWSSDDAALDASRRVRKDTGETVRVHLQLPLHVRRLLQLPAGLHARVRRAASASRAPIVHPQQWPEDLDYARQAGRGHRLRRDGDDAGAGDGRQTSATS